MMKSIFLYAYDQINLGDDLFVQFIAKRYPGIKFYIWTDKQYKYVFRHMKNILVIDRGSHVLKLLSKIHPSFPVRIKQFLERKSSAVVYIGGSIFIEYPNWEQICNWWEYQAKTYPFFILGANFGPYITENYQKKHAEIFSKATDVCFRDLYSYGKFQNIETVRYAPDILFGYQMPKVECVSGQIFISVISCFNKAEGQNSLNQFAEAYRDFMYRLVSQYLEHGHKVVLSSFCKNEGDEDTIKYIMDKIENPNIQAINYVGTNLEECLQRLASSEYIISTRFHGMILGSVAGKPILPIIYSDKTLNVLRDVKFSGRYVDIRCLDNLSYEELQYNYKNHICMDVRMLRKKANNHFKILDRWIKNG